MEPSFREAHRPLNSVGGSLLHRLTDTPTESDTWQTDGFRSAADQLAQLTGTSPGAARRTLEAGRQLAEQPELAAAGLAGELSAEQIQVISDAAGVNPVRTGELMDKARKSSLGELRQEAARVKAEKTDLETRRQQVHARRSMRRFADTDGGYHTRIYGTPEDGAALWQAIDPIRRRLIVLRREAHVPNEPLAAVDYDALLTLARIAAGHEDGELDFADLADLGLFPQLATTRPTGPSPAAAPELLPATGSEPANSSSAQPARPAAPPGRRPRAKKLAGRPAKLIIRVELDTLLRGYPLEGELCEIPGYGPIPVSVIEDLVASGQTFIAAVLTKGRQLLGVFHQGRYPNAYQRTALEFLYPECAATGCHSRNIQWDHRTDWTKTHYTVLDGMDGLCQHHHKLKTEKHWALTPGTGKRAFVPPTDRRHPNHPFHPQRRQIQPVPSAAGASP